MICTNFTGLERKVPSFGTLDFKYDPNDNEWTQIEEVLDNLHSLIKAGKVRYVGLSNETPWGVMKFYKLLMKRNYQEWYQFKMYIV